MANPAPWESSEPLLGQRTQDFSHITACSKQYSIQVCAGVHVHTRLYMSAHRRRSYKREDSCSKPQPIHQALSLDGTGLGSTTCFIHSLPLSTSLQGEMLSSGPQEMSQGSFPGAQLTTGDDKSKTKQADGAERLAARKRERAHEGERIAGFLSQLLCALGILSPTKETNLRKAR